MTAGQQRCDDLSADVCPHKLRRPRHRVGPSACHIPVTATARRVAIRHAGLMRTRIPAAATTAAALLSLAACTPSHDDAKSTPATPSTATTAAPSPSPTSTQADATALVKSVTDYTADLFSGKADGYNLVSARCKQQMTKAAWTELAKGAHHQYGSQTATGIHIDQQSGDLARVSYGAGNIPQFNRTSQPWARESGTWRWDACPSTG